MQPLSQPPQTIISLPVQTPCAVCSASWDAPAVAAGVQVLVAGL